MPHIRCPAGAGLFSATGPVIAILAGDVFVGEAEGHINGSGTFQIQSLTRPDLICRGQFTHSVELGNAGTMQCSDGATGAFQFKRLSLVRGHGGGSFSRGSMSFTYGLSSSEAGPYLKLPQGKLLRLDGKDLLLVDASLPVPAGLPLAIPVAPVPEQTAPAVIPAVLRNGR
jgi:hypothetical protein